MKTLLLSGLLLLSFNSHANITVNTAIMLDAMEDTEKKSDKYEIRAIYIYKTKKMNHGYSHTTFYDYKLKKLLFQKTCTDVKEKVIMMANYNITGHSYSLCKKGP